MMKGGRNNLFRLKITPTNFWGFPCKQVIVHFVESLRKVKS
jgi:hypothetical protein